MANLWKDPEFVRKADATKQKAWTNFLNHFPKANKSRFVSQESIGEKNNATAEVFLKESKGLLQSVFGSDRKYWSAEMKRALGGQQGFSLSIVATWFKSFFANPCGNFQRKSAKLEENIQH